MQFFTRLAKRPFLLLLGIVGLSVIFVLSIANNAALETDLNEYMPKTHPAFVASDEAESLFGINDAILIVVEHPNSIYNSQTIEKIADITEALPEEFEEVTSVTSLTTADNIKSDDGFLEVEPFFTGKTSEQAISQMQEEVEANPMIWGRNVSKDGTATLIIAELQEDVDSTALQKKLTAWVEQWQGPETLLIAGRPIVEGSLAELGPKDMAIMFPLVIVTMIILLLLLLRSVRDTILNMIIVLFGTLVSFGLMTLLGIPIYAVDTMIPVMLIAIGVAYGIHMHNTIHHLIQSYPEISKGELANQALKQMVKPIIMTAVTTAIGFVALMSSQVLPVRYFGLFAALGVLSEMLLALLLFPASIYLLGKPKYKESKREITSRGGKASHAGSFQRLLDERPKLIVLISLAILVAGLWGTSKVWIDTSFLANFEEDSDIVQTDQFVNSKFGGTSTLNIILSGDESDLFKHPEVLQAMDSMQADLEENPIVGNTLSLATFIKQMNQVMMEYEEGTYSIPDSQNLISQYLLLYEFSGDPESLQQVIDYEYTSANITVQLKSDSSAVLKDILAVVNNYQPQFSEYGITVGYAGSGYKAFIFSELLLEGQIVSLLISFAIIILLLAILFKNLRIGLVGTVPIAITAIVNFGVMGLLGIPLSSATALITSIAIGIGVDYAIHFLEHYTNMRLEGSTLEEATKQTLAHTGRAIIFNAIAVMGGFAILMFSVFPPNRQVGALIVLNMATSAIGTLTILVVLVHALDKKQVFLPKTHKLYS
ncbi:MAG: RND family transporter [Sphaerochaeta sp.]